MYQAILKRSLLLAWREKRLWWLGLIIAVSFPFQWISEEQLTLDALRTYAQELVAFAVTQGGMFALAAAAVLIICFIGILVRSFAKGTVILLLRETLAGRTTELSKGMREGKKVALRILLLSFVAGSTVLLSLLLLFGPVVWLGSSGRFSSATLLAAIAVLILGVISAIASFVYIYGVSYIVLLNFTVRSAFLTAFELFRRHWRKSVLMAAYVVLVQLVATALVVTASTGAMFLITKTSPFFAGVLAQYLWLINLLLVTLLLGSFLAIFQTAVWVQMFLEFVKPIKTQDPALSKVAPEPEPVE